MKKRVLVFLLGLALTLGANPLYSTDGGAASIGDGSLEEPQTPPSKKKSSKKKKSKKIRKKKKKNKKPKIKKKKSKKKSKKAPKPLPPPKPANPGQAAAKLLNDAFGPKVVAVLSSHGYLVLHEEEKELSTLLYIPIGLEELTRLSPKILNLVETFQGYQKGEKIARKGKPPAFMELLDLPPGGLMTADLRSLAQLLAGLHSSANSLSYKKKPSKTPDVLLFETKWGKNFAARTHADVIDDPMPLAKPFFNEFLASIRPLKDAVGHFIGFVQTNYDKDIAALLEHDAKSGNASEELRAWLRRYLTDQRRLIEVKRAKTTLTALVKTKTFKKNLANAEDVALPLSYNPKLPGRVRKSLAQGSPPAFVSMTSIGLHLMKAARLRRHELGDKVLLSGGYWLDGLERGDKAVVQEITFADYGPQGIDHIKVRHVKRDNGGPYTFKRELTLNDSRDFIFRSIISVTGATPLSEEVPVEVSPEFSKALVAMANAEQQILDCNMAGAEDALMQLSLRIQPLARQKKQYKSLYKTVRKRRKRIKKLMKKVAKLEETIEASRKDSSPEVCDYDPKRTLAAIKQVRALPPGCDRYLPELLHQREIILKRKSDQAAFSRAVSKARWKKLFCHYSEAAERLSYALSLLDADPAARCGEIAEAAKKADRDLENVGAYSRWIEHFNVRFEEAEIAAGVIGADDSDPETSLALLNNITARIPSLPTAACMKGERRQARKLALANGEGMQHRGGALAFMPPDTALAETASAVIRERRRLDEASALLRERSEAQQRPIDLAEAPTTEPATPENRLECLEDGMVANAATIDCNGNPFEVQELMRLRKKLKRPDDAEVEDELAP